MMWIDNQGTPCKYVTLVTWDTIRSRSGEVEWSRLVWFPQCIPRQAFHVWLLFRNKLKTQDRLKIWEVGSATNMGLMCCSLCNHDINSRNHLFFRCPFASQVWLSLRSKAYMEHIDGNLEDIAAWLQLTRRQSAKNVIGRMVFAASTYFIWAERNLRMFHTSKCTFEQIVDIIDKNVRCRLWSCKFKDTANSRKVMEDWCIPRDALLSGEEDPG